MIRRTFQLLKGVGPSLEKSLWERGIVSWDHFPAAGGETVLSAAKDEPARQRLAEAGLALAQRNLVRLAELFPLREQWRLYADFARDAVFFDIETDGRELQAPTVVSLFHAEGFEVFLQGRNLDALPAALARWPLWITFNGSVFDVPVLKTYFGGFPEPAMHLDLRFWCQRLGLRGGLKKLEGQLGFARPPHLCGVDGMDAVLLWRAYRESADLQALRFLVEYNLYDSIQLRTLADLLFNRSAERLGFEGTRIPVFARGDVLYDVSSYLLQLAPTADDRALLERIRRRDRDVSE